MVVCRKYSPRSFKAGNRQLADIAYAGRASLTAGFSAAACFL